MLTIFLVALFGFVLLSVPIAFALILTTLVLMFFMHAISPALLIQNIFRGIDSFPLMAIPFFLLAGEIMNVGAYHRRARLCDRRGEHALRGCLRIGGGRYLGDWLAALPHYAR